MKKYGGAHRVKNVTGMAQISIDLKPNRSVSDVYINQKMDLTELVKYVEKKKKAGENITINIKGRHDPIIVPRAVVVVESMCAFTLLDAMISNMSARADRIIDFYK